ncbi:MAG: hypothetical protein FWC27_01265, partial [Firmicutes bacterium]|nr:hypothetical protein [Bacillota bacterium]
PKPDATTQSGETIVPPGGATTPGGAAAPGGAQGEEPTEAPGQKNYSSPKRIPTVKRGKDYSDNAVPDGVADIYAVDGKLLFTFVTRLEGDDATKTARDFYTLFEYNPQNGGCRAVSPEVGYIVRAGDLFVYDKAGVGLGAENYWDVPYFTNNSAWTDEKEITGAEAQKLIGAPAAALLKGKVQPYTVQRSGAAVTIHLPESGEKGEVLALNLDLRGIAGQGSADSLMIDIRGAANEKLWFSVGSVAKDTTYGKELYAVPIAGGVPKAVRYGELPIWVDPIGHIQDGAIYGYSIRPDKSRALLRVDAAAGKVQPLATVREAVWHFVANDAYVLYQIPGKDGKVELGCKKIAAAA